MFYLNCLEYSQGSQKCVATIMSFKQIDSISKVLIYDEEEYGYQRSLNKTHFMRIKKNLLINDDLVSPTSIILGINRSDFEKIEYTCIIDNVLKMQFNKNDKIFRVIDGQHRLQGIREASKENKNIFEYMLNVIIMVIDDENRSKEVKIFSDINAKAKNLKSDLTILAQYRHDLLERKFSINYLEHIAVAAAHYINEDKAKENVWRNGIKLDINTPRALGIVGFKSFYETLKAIVENITMDMTDSKFKELCYSEQLSFIDKMSMELAFDILIPAWEFVYNKWSKCFKSAYVYYNGMEYITNFDNNYYIQKTMGTKAINGLLSEFITKSKDISTGMSEFENRIKVSHLSYEDWMVGGTFAGLSSLSGVNKIASKI